MRFLVMGLMTLALAGVSYAQPVHDGARRNQSTAKGNQSPAENANIAAEVRRIAGALEAQNSGGDSRAKQESQRTERDLIAQENMVYWTKAMFWAALAQAILSAVGIVLIFVTFKEARRAADSGDRMAEEAANANSAAIAAAEAAQAANRISQGQSRPWLSVKLEQPPKLYWTGGETELVGKFIVTNVGRLPAFDVIQAFCDFLPGSQPDFPVTSLIANFPEDMLSGGLVVFPNEVRELEFGTHSNKFGDGPRSHGTLVVLVAYRFEGSDQVHFTPVSWTIPMATEDHGKPVEPVASRKNIRAT